MIQQDYVLVIIEQFFLALRRALERRKKDQSQFDNDFDDLYQSYLKVSRSFLISGGLNNFLTTLDNSPEGLAKKEMLSELWFQELQIYQHPNQKEIAARLLALYDDLDQNTSTISLTRLQRRKYIDELLTHL